MRTLVVKRAAITITPTSPAAGIGMRFATELGAEVVVVAVTPGGPAARAGVAKGMTIYEIDGVATAGRVLPRRLPASRPVSHSA